MSSWYYAETLQPPYPVTAEVNANHRLLQYLGRGPGRADRAQGSVRATWNSGFGYTENMTSASKGFNYFPPGEYTIVAEDAWGQTATGHFTVSSAPAQGTYTVTFQQIGACSPPVYTVPWSITFGGVTQARPTNTPLPIANGSYTA